MARITRRLPRRTTLLALAIAFTLTGCASGTRAELRPDLLTTGNDNADEVLDRLLRIGEATYTADYDSVVQFDQVSTPVQAAQDGIARRALTIGDIRYITGSSSGTARPMGRTCVMPAGTCDDGHDAARVSNTLLTPDFFGTSVPARLRRDVGLAIAQPELSTEEFEGQPVTCVAVPLSAPASAPDSEPESVYCVLDNGVLTRLEASDLVVTMTSYTDTFDDSLLDP